MSEQRRAEEEREILVDARYCPKCQRFIEWDGHTESSHLRADLEIAVAALRTIAGMDYRGNRPNEAYMAEDALKRMESTHGEDT